MKTQKLSVGRYLFKVAPKLVQKDATEVLTASLRICLMTHFM